MILVVPVLGTRDSHYCSSDSGGVALEHNREGQNQLLERKQVYMDAGHDIFDVTEMAPDLIEALDHVKTLGFVDPLDSSSNVGPTANMQLITSPTAFETSLMTTLLHAMSPSTV